MFYFFVTRGSLIGSGFRVSFLWVAVNGEKGELAPVAAAKTEQITAELQRPNSKPAVDPVERINTRFSKLKTKKYITNPDCTMNF
ncbi:hypothetical protein L1887_30388 [Cichorium endivia]|nr:hypothetical protein L1887_30388 [Cichorium endivia]